MKIKKVMILLTMILFCSGCSPGGDETPVCSYIPKSEAIKGNCAGIETGKAAGSIEADVERYAPKMEGNFIKESEFAVASIEEDSKDGMYNEEAPAVQSLESAEQPDMGLCVGLAKEIFDATNAEREAAGIEPLVWDDELAEYADIRAEEIITNFSHVRTDGTKCYVLSTLIYGENIARGPHANGEDFLEHWMDSEGHKENILNPEYVTIGIGFTCTEQGDTAVQLFGIN